MVPYTLSTSSYPYMVRYLTMTVVIGDSLVAAGASQLYIDMSKMPGFENEVPLAASCTSVSGPNLFR